MTERPAGRRPIGIFDSGVGGLTVLSALRRRLPGESFLYLGDTARLPYGTKSAETVQRYALNATAHLLRHGIKLLVVACNTATSFALPELVESSPVPVAGVVEPGVRAALALGVHRIGVIGTEGTIRSGSYQRTLERLGAGVSVRGVACPLFVPLAEEGWGDHPITDQVARTYLKPLLEWGAEALILGCTHYPLLIPSLERVAGHNVRLVDSASSVAEAVAESYASILEPAASGGEVVIHLTDASDHFLKVTRNILGVSPRHLEVVHLDE